MHENMMGKCFGKSSLTFGGKEENYYQMQTDWFWKLELERAEILMPIQSTFV